MPLPLSPESLDLLLRPFVGDFARVMKLPGLEGVLPPNKDRIRSRGVGLVERGGGSTKGGGDVGLAMS